MSGRKPKGDDLMESFKNQIDMYYKTKYNIIEKIQNSIDIASDNGQFYTIYSTHTYEGLDSLGIIALLKSSGYDIHKIEHPLDKDYNYAIIFWR